MPPTTPPHPAPSVKGLTLILDTVIYALMLGIKEHEHVTQAYFKIAQWCCFFCGWLWKRVGHSAWIHFRGSYVQWIWTSWSILGEQILFSTRRSVWKHTANLITLHALFCTEMCAGVFPKKIGLITFHIHYTKKLRILNIFNFFVWLIYAIRARTAYMNYTKS